MTQQRCRPHRQAKSCKKKWRNDVRSWRDSRYTWASTAITKLTTRCWTTIKVSIRKTVISQKATQALETVFTAITVMATASS